METNYVHLQKIWNKYSVHYIQTYSWNDADCTWIHRKHHKNVWDFNSDFSISKEFQVHMYGIAIDLYESIMYIYAINYKRWIYKYLYFKRAFFQIDLYHLNNNGKTVLLYISLVFFKFNNFFFILKDN